jgi:hypothetical protein
MKRLWMLLPALGLLASCAAPDTLVQSTDAAAIARASTFAIEAPPAASDAVASADVARLRAAVESEIGRSLAAKGYRPAERATADLWIAYRLVPMGRIAREDRENPIAASRPSMGPGDPYGTYEPLAGAGGGERLGMLLVTITDARSGAIVWQATSEGMATTSASAARGAARGTHAALAKLPQTLHRAP